MGNLNLSYCCDMHYYKTIFDESLFSPAHATNRETRNRVDEGVKLDGSYCTEERNIPLPLFPFLSAESTVNRTAVQKQKYHNDLTDQLTNNGRLEKGWKFVGKRAQEMRKSVEKIRNFRVPLCNMGVMCCHEHV